MRPTMRAILCDGRGGPEVLTSTDVPRPEPGPEELLVRVRAAALNRADTMQREGEFEPPPGETAVPGVEIAGEVAAWGERVTGFAPGDRVFGLVNGGGYAEYCLLDHGMAVRTPSGWSDAAAAAVPEAFFVAHETLFELARLTAGETVLVHAAGSGMGSVCIQLARAAGARVLCTAGSDAKLAQARELGAEHGVNYRTHDFADEVLRLTGGAGVDVIEDFVGADFLGRNLAVLKEGGRLVQIGLLSGPECPIDLEPVVLKRLQILGTSMRRRPLEVKREITARFRDRWLPRLVAGEVRPVVDSTFPLVRVADAHRAMEANRHFGKIVLTLD